MNDCPGPIAYCHCFCYCCLFVLQIDHRCRVGPTLYNIGHNKVCSARSTINSPAKMLWWFQNKSPRSLWAIKHLQKLCGCGESFARKKKHLRKLVWRVFDLHLCSLPREFPARKFWTIWSALIMMHSWRACQAPEFQFQILSEQKKRKPLETDPLVYSIFSLKYLCTGAPDPTMVVRFSKSSVGSTRLVHKKSAITSETNPLSGDSF